MNETEQMLALLNAGFPDISNLGPIEARAEVDARIRPVANLTDAETEDCVIDREGGPLAIRIYRPCTTDAPATAASVTPAASVAPVATIYAHGGGFLHGSIQGHDSFCRTFAQHTGMPVVSVDYRLAPEHGAPSGSCDLVSATEWAATQRLGQTFVLAGDSSGANLAAVAALALRGHATVRVAAQVLLYPFLDPTMSSPSYRRLGDTNFVTATTLATYWRHYLAAPGTATATPWQVNPALAPTHEGAPPAIVVTAGLDPLQDEGRDYAHRLAAAGTPVLLRHYPDQFHGFATIPGYGPARSAQAMLWSDLRRTLAHPAPFSHNR